MYLFNTEISDLKKLQEILGYQFTDINLLKCALTRQSAVEERRQARERGSFQRLEFIGDKILNLVVAQILYDGYPTWTEGQLTKETERFINNKALTNIARKWQLGKYLIVGRGEEIHIRENPKALADAAEAVLGAIFQDSNNNFQVIKNFVRQHWSVIGLVAQPLIPSVSCTPAFDVYNDIIFCEDRNEKINKIIHLMKKGINKVDLQDIFDHYLEDISILKVLCQFKLDQELLDNGLIESVRRCLPEQVELLLSCRANSNYVQKTKDEYDYGDTTSSSEPYTISVLQCAVESCYSEESIQIIKALLSAKANPNWQDAVYWSSRIYKRRNNDDELYGVKPHVEEIREKKTALHIIVNGDSPFKEALIELLIQYKANPNLADSDGNTPLHLAANNYHMDFKRNIYHLLIRLGANPQQGNVEHETPEQCCQKALISWDESMKKMREYSHASMLLFGIISKHNTSKGSTETKYTTVPVPTETRSFDNL
jgi:hypothetical protein